MGIFTISIKEMPLSNLRILSGNEKLQITVPERFLQKDFK